MIKRIRHFRDDTRGQAMVIASAAMFIAMLMAALAIDTAAGYERHHQAQVAADAAALAAANCLANAGASGDTCTSTTDTTAAANVATTIASANGIPIPTSDVSFAGAKVTVATSSASATLFDNAAGIHTTTTAANAVAAYTTGTPATCTTQDQSAGDCYAIYAANAACGTADGFITNSADIDISGEVHSQGSLNFYSNGGSYDFSSITASTGNCYSGSGGGPIAYPANSTMDGAKPTLGGGESSGYWPDDYATLFTPCTSGACTGPNGTPSWCNSAAANYSFSSGASPAGAIECAYGTGTPSTPSTWNGGFTFDNGADFGTSSNPAALTMIGGYIDLAGGEVYIKAAAGADGCLAYAEEAIGSYSDPSVYVLNGDYGLDGDIFAPNGTIQITSSASTGSFLEALNVELNDVSFTGNGPISSGATTATGSDTLVR